MKDFGKLKAVDPRQIWDKGEAQDFTPWLAENIQELGKTLGMDLTIEKVEADVGDFSLDLLAKDLSTGRIVIIENQLSQTNHDHLGKLLTYAGGLDASVVVWISTSVRDEHRQALEWLNQKTDSNTAFFGVEIEVLQIDNSKPAFNFKPIVYPIKNIPVEGGPSERAKKYRDHFQLVINELREKHQFTNAKVAQPQSWYSFSSGFPDFIYSTSFAAGGKVRAEIYIDSGEGEKNKNTFDNLLSKKEKIESLFGEPLTWERLDNRRASRIAVYRDGSIDEDETKLKEYRNWAIERLLKFKKVFGEGLDKF